MKKIVSFLIILYTSTAIYSYWPGSNPRTLPKSAKVRNVKFSPNRPGSVFHDDSVSIANFGQAEALLERELQKLSENEGWDVVPSTKRDMLTPEEILSLLNSNNPALLEKTVWLYDQPFTIRELLAEVQKPVSEYSSDMLAQILESYYIKQAAEQYEKMQERKDVALMEMRIAIINTLDSLLKRFTQELNAEIE
ncbi:hypothetical protein KAZ82_00815 [Candidatus Babeliales bacterium]|nr:hypothetical protein [Candidatus Babeliales bacterium]